MILAAAILIFSASENALGDEYSKTNTPPRRPKIGLVLEGGGALGFAHVGVLKVLEENRVPIDVVAGTSIGSIVGAGYASGLTVPEMERALSETKWDDLFGERVQRGDLTYRLKAGRNRELYGDAKLGIKGGKFASPAGLIIGQNILPLFQNLFRTLPSPCDFDSLPLPFRAITADLETGKAYIPSRGNLAAVVRASMSVPGVFSPVEIDGHLLIDGGIVNNLPIDVAKEMGADVVIVSVLDDELLKRQDLQSLVAVSGQMISLLLQQNSDISRKTVRPEDVLVAIPLKGYTAGDFAKAREIMEIGEKAARGSIDDMRRYSVSEEEYARYQANRTKPVPPPVQIDFVRVKNSSEISDERILKQVTLKPGDTFDREQMEKDVQKIFGTGYFNSVHYDVVRDGDKNGIEIDAAGKGWLEQFVRFGFSIEDNFEGDSSFRLGAAYRRYNMTTEGSYGEAQFEIGKTPRLGLEYYQPFGDSAYFIAPLLNYQESPITVRRDGDTLAEYELKEYNGSFLLGREIGSYGEAGIGLARGYGSVNREVGNPVLNEFDYDVGEASARINIDTVDTPDFPTKGVAARLAYTSSLKDLGASDEFDTLNGAVTLPYSFGRNTILFGADFANTFDDRPVERSFSFGGFLDISGTRQGFLSASDYTQGKIVYFRRFSEVENPLFNFGFFYGGSVEVSNLESDIEQLPDHRALVSGSIFLGADTPILPTYLGYGRSDEQEDSFFLAVGRVGQVRR